MPRKLSYLILAFEGAAHHCIEVYDIFQKKFVVGIFLRKNVRQNHG